MQDLLLVGPALRLSDFLDLCRAAKPESVLFHPETTALRIKAINAAAADQLEAQAQGKAVDCLRLPAELSIQNVRLIALDMDSTLIANECIDDMAAIAGCGPEMARLTREAMEGLWPFSKISLNACAFSKAPTPESHFKPQKTSVFRLVLSD